MECAGFTGKALHKYPGVFVDEYRHCFVLSSKFGMGFSAREMHNFQSPIVNGDAEKLSFSPYSLDDFLGCIVQIIGSNNIKVGSVDNCLAFSNLGAFKSNHKGDF